ATDFAKEENRKAFEAALIQVESELGMAFPLVIGGERITTTDKLESINPSSTEQTVGTVSKASKGHVDAAMMAAGEAFESWKKWEQTAMVELLLRVGAIIRRRKYEFSALMVYEAGKPWEQTVCDTNEGINFIEYYARTMMKLADGKPVLDREG